MKAYIRILDLFPLFCEIKAGKRLDEIKKEILFECKTVISDDINEIKNEKSDLHSPQSAEKEIEKKKRNRIDTEIRLDSAENRLKVHEVLAKNIEGGEKSLKNAKNIGEVVSLLPKFYKNYIEEAKNETRRAERLGAFIVLSSLYYEIFGTSLPDFLKTAKGKPYFSDNHAFFSISHSENLVCSAFCPCEWGNDAGNIKKSEKSGDYSPLYKGVGIDIEAKIENDDEEAQKTAKSVAKRFFAEEESRALNSLCKEDFTREFALLWTKKESLVKMTGVGFSDFRKANDTSAFFSSYEIKTKEKDFILSLCIE